MSGVVGVFAIAGSRVPCEPQIAQMAKSVSDTTDYQYAFSDHRLRLEALINPSLEQSTFQCPETGSFVWLHGSFRNNQELLSRIGSGGAESHNPSELLLRLYQTKGLLCVPMLRGSFCAVVWDAEEHRLALVRDQLGTKNLYFSQDGDNLWFASSQQALRSLQPPELNFTGLHSLLMTGATPLGETLIRKVETVRPGEIFLADRGRSRNSRYWQFEYSDYVGNPEPAQVQSVLGECVDQVLERAGKSRVSVFESSALGAEGTTGVLTHLFQNQSRYALDCAAKQSEPSVTRFRTLVQLWGQPFGSIQDFTWAQTIAQGQPHTRVVLPAGEGEAFGLHPAFNAFRWQMRQRGSEQCRQLDPLWALRPLLNVYAQTKSYFAPHFISDLEQQALVFDKDRVPEWQNWTGLRQVQSGVLHFHLHSLVSRLAHVALSQSLALELPFVSLDLMDMLAVTDPQVHCRGVVGGQLLRTAFDDSLVDAQWSDSRKKDIESKKHLQSDTSSVWSVCAHVLRRASQQHTLPFNWAKIAALCDRLHAQPFARALTPSLAPSAADQRSALFLASYTIWYESVIEDRCSFALQEKPSL